MAGALRRDHNAVDILVQFDQAEVHRETVRENDGLALGEVREDVALIDRCLLHVRQADHNDIGEANRLRRIKNREAMLLRYGAGLRTRIEADDDLAAAVLQIERMGVALRTIAEDGERFVFEHAEIGVFVGVDFGGHRRKLRVDSCVGKVEAVEPASALKCEPAGAGKLKDAEGLEEPEQRADLLVIAGRFDDERVGGKVHDLGPKDIRNLENLRPRFRIGTHLDEDELAGDRLAFLEIDDFDYIHELPQLLDTDIE